MPLGRNKKIIATIEARMDSSRLPGKMTLELYPGLPALGAVIERLGASKSIGEVVVATATSGDNDILENIAKKFNASCYRGSEDDVLGRVMETGKMAKGDIMVLITGDCSCISPALIDEAMSFFLDRDYDFLTNGVRLEYPIGIDVQIATLEALIKAHRLASEMPYCADSNNFEHTNYFIRKHPEIFRIYHYPAPEKYRMPDVKIALDTKEDYEAIKKIYARLYSHRRVFDLDDIFSLFKREPGIRQSLTKAGIKRAGY